MRAARSRSAGGGLGPARALLRDREEPVDLGDGQHLRQDAARASAPTTAAVGSAGA